MISENYVYIFQLLFRDPNSVETFKSFENCIDWAINGSFSDQDIDEAKLGVFSMVCKLRQNGPCRKQADYFL